MFLSLFLSKRKKLVKKWTKDHVKIVELSHKIISKYSLHDYPSAKKHLQELSKVAINHLMVEDIELYKLLKEDKKIDRKTQKHITEFKESFRTIKMSLIVFLTKYSNPNVVLDEVFFKSFNEIVKILLERIEFEEKNLYITLNEK